MTLEINNKTEFYNRFEEPGRTHIGDAKPDGCPLAAGPQRLSGMVLVSVSERPDRFIVDFPTVSHSGRKLMPETWWAPSLATSVPPLVCKMKAN